MRRSGSADLPLHPGRVPHWLGKRMASLGRAITIAIVEEYGRDEFLKRISDPFWFQAFGSVLGMDWHSSGITTSVMGALKKSLNPISDELGIYICGGRGKHSLKTPDELLSLSNQHNFNGTELVRASKLSAKVDNCCINDGFQLYLHSFILTKEGNWSVVQQGMNNSNGMARRYHWHSPKVDSFVSNPHSGISGEHLGEIQNLSDLRAEDARTSIVDFLQAPVESQLKEFRHLVMAKPHQISEKEVNSKRLGATLALAHDKKLRSFSEALLTPGIGPRTMQSLALVSEVVYGAPTRFDDPARFAFAHGGKDGAPFPVPTKVYDETIEFLNKNLSRAKGDESDKREGFKKLHSLQKVIEKHGNYNADIPSVIESEWRNSHKYGGRTIKGYVKPNSPVPPELKPPQQLSFL